MAVVWAVLLSVLQDLEVVLTAGIQRLLCTVYVSLARGTLYIPAQCLGMYSFVPSETAAIHHLCFSNFY